MKLLLFQNMNYIRSNSYCLKYQRLKMWVICSKMGNIFISGRKLKTSYIRRLWNWDIQWWRKTHDSKANIFNHLIFIYFCKTNDKIKNWGSLSVMNSAVAVSLSIYLIVLFIFCIIILSFVTWPVIPARIIMFINKSVEYRLLFSIYGHTGPYNHVY